MRHHRIGLLDLQQGRTRMARLPAALLAAALAPAAPGRELGRPVTRRRLVTVVAILVQAVFQFGHARGQHLYLLAQLGLGGLQLFHQGHHRVRASGIYLQDFVTR